MATPRVFTYHCAYCSNLFLASTHDFSILPKRKDPGLDHAIIVPLPPPPKSEDESDSSSEEESSSEEDEPQEQVKPAEPQTSKKPEAPNVEKRGKENSEEVELATPATVQEKTHIKREEKLPAVRPSETASESTRIAPAAAPPPSSLTTMAPPPLVSANISSDVSSTATPPLQTREKDDYTLILSLTKDRTAQIITREDGFEKRWIWRCGRCRIISGYQLDDAHFDPPGSTVSDVLDEKEKKRNDRKRKRYLYILPGAALPTEELGRELKEKEIDILALDV